MITSFVDNQGSFIYEFVGEPPKYKKNQTITVLNESYEVLEVFHKRNLTEIIVRKL